jgi:hypothetical protein
MDFASLPTHELGTVLSFLDTRSVVRFQLSAKLITHAVDSCEGFWKAACERDWPAAGPRALVTTWRHHWAVQCGLFGSAALPYMARAQQWWQRVERFAARHFPAVLQTLGSPASAEDVAAAEAATGCRVPPHLRAVYAYHNGQVVTGRTPRERLLSCLPAIFGCTFVYDSIMLRRMLSVSESARAMSEAPVADKKRAGLWCLTGLGLSESLWVANDANGSLYIEDGRGKLAPAGSSKPGL